MNRHWLLGMTVTVVIPGEETGWDEDRGRPEHIAPDAKITGVVDQVSEPGVFGGRQVRLNTGLNEDGEPVYVWAWDTEIKTVHAPAELETVNG